MLKNIDPLLSPNLLKYLRAMGHGDDPVIRMQVVDRPDEVPSIYEEFQSLLTAATLSRVSLATVERFEFYGRTRNDYAVLATAERRLYGNILLRKGVIGDGKEDTQQ